MRVVGLLTRHGAIPKAAVIGRCQDMGNEPTIVPQKLPKAVINGRG